MYKIYGKNISKGNSNTKRVVKFLGICQDPRLQLRILQQAPDSVYKSICNAFYNIAQNPDFQLPIKHRHRFSKYNRIITNIISPQVSIKKKRKIIQRGGFPFLGVILPAVISTALSFIGSKFIKSD